MNLLGIAAMASALAAVDDPGFYRFRHRARKNKESSYSSPRLDHRKAAFYEGNPNHPEFIGPKQPRREQLRRMKQIARLAEKK